MRRHFHGEELVAISFVVGLFTLGAVVRIYRVLYHTTPATLNAERGAAAKASP